MDSPALDDAGRAFLMETLREVLWTKSSQTPNRPIPLYTTMTLDEVNLEIARRTYLLKRRIEQLEKALRSGRRLSFVWLVCLNTASLVAGLILLRAIRHLRP